MMKPTTAAAAAILLAALAGTGARAADTKDMKIALSNSYAGNSWRQAMLRSWDKIGKQAVADHVLAEATAFTTAENQATAQAAQIQDMILQGYNAIVINAASPTALNGTVKQACDAGIVVVSFDSIVTEPCAYRIGVDFKKLGSMQIDYFKSRGLKGNLLEVRGVAGTSVDDDIHAGTETASKADGDFKIVGSVHGNWTQTIAQKEVAGVLPTLPDIVAVATQGGDGYGTAQAFKDGGRKVPVIFLGNREDELAWWKAQRDANGYQTESASIAPGASTFALWVTKKILAGETLPHDMLLPLTVVTGDKLDETLKTTEKGSVANVEYSEADVTALLNKTGK